MTTKIVQKNIPQGWTLRKISDVLDYERPDNYIVKSTNYDSNNKTPVLTANKSFILGYTDENFGIYKDVPVIIFDDFTTDSKYVDFPFKVKSSAIKILKCKDQSSDLKFVYEIMNLIKFPIANHKRYYISQYQNLEILMPKEKTEQQKIAEILGAVDEDILKTQEVINKAEKLKRGLMQELFTRGIGNKKFRRTEFGDIPENWKISKLNKVADFTNGKAHEKNIVPFGKYIVINSKFISTDGIVIKYSDEGHSLLSVGDIAMVMSDVPNGKAIAKCFYVEENNKYTLNQRICSIRAKKEIDSRFLFYILNRNQYFLKHDDGVGQTNLRKDEVLNCPVPIPPMEEQKEIVNIIRAIDEKISINKKLKSKFIRLKKGLANDLLSGEVRING